MHGVAYGYAPTYLPNAVAPASAVGRQCPTGVIVGRFYPKLEKPSNSSRNNFGKIAKKELAMTLRITKFLCVIFFHFKALSCIR